MSSTKWYCIDIMAVHLTSFGQPTCEKKTIYTTTQHVSIDQTCDCSGYKLGQNLCSSIGSISEALLPGPFKSISQNLMWYEFTSFRNSGNFKTENHSQILNGMFVFLQKWIVWEVNVGRYTSPIEYFGIIISHGFPHDAFCQIIGELIHPLGIQSYSQMVIKVPKSPSEKQ